MKMDRVLPCGLLLALLGACSKPETPPCEPTSPATVAAPAETPEHRQLMALFADDWERQLRDSPINASFFGDTRYNNRWDDLSPAGFEARLQGSQAALQKLEAIDRSKLSADDQLNYDLFKQMTLEGEEAYRHGSHLRPMDQRGGLQTANEILESIRLEKTRDYEDWLARLEAFGVVTDQTIELMKAGLHQGRGVPRILLQRVSVQIKNQIVADPLASPYYAPFKNFADGVPEADRERLRTAAQAAIRDTVIPAYKRLQDYFDKVYLPASPLSPSLSAQPGGADFYAFLVRQHTTTSLTPDQIHEIGLKEVARIRAEMEKIREQVGYKGDLLAFFQHLRTDPKFFYKDPNDLLAAYSVIAKRIDPELVRLFGKLPRTPYGVRAIPETSAPDVTTAYYYPPGSDGLRAGYYYVNLYKPETRPKWEMEALTAHESVPGHHLQIALQQELGEMPAFRKYAAGFTAYVEGWGLYSESLGGELGLYKDPYSRFGQLTYEMWRAVRLVVDTGLHAKDWTRDQAIDYFKANAPKTELDIVNEIDRYISMPGQALAYKIGELKIKELRARAEQRLGERFDIRAFHDAVLASGAVPLNILEQRIDAWIDGQLPPPAAQATGT